MLAVLCFALTGCERGSPALADGTPLKAFAGEWPAGWPAELKLVSGNGIWAGDMAQKIPAGPGRQSITGRLYLEQPLEQVAADMKRLLEQTFGSVSTATMTRDGLPVQGFQVYVKPEQRAEFGFISALVTVSPPAPGELAAGSQRRIQTVLAIQRMQQEPAAQ
jgi:hypothetical protein